MGKTAFISYASDDETVANTISAYLERNAVSCWVAPRDVHPGADYAAEIIDGIETSAVLVLVLSEHANDSVFVKREVERAVSKGKPIFPVRVREVVPSKSLELFISSAEWIDAWQPPIEQYLERLAESIRSAASLYPAGGGDRAGAAAPPVADRHVNRAVAMAAPETAVRRTKVVQTSLVVVVVVLAALLAWTTFRRPAAPVPSVASDRPPGIEPPAATTATRAAPSQPEPAAAVPPEPAAAVPGTHATGPCPGTLSINRELPTPFSCVCGAPALSGGAVWGTDVYTDDSSLCRAALHAGVIPPQGGSITVIRSEGRALYVGSPRNGVTSSDYGAFAKSIEFRGTAPVSGPLLCPAALSINRDLPMPFTCRCSAQATRAGAVWGTDAYTDDSSLCRAARHAGVTGSEGGTITVMRSDGLALYVGSTRNGVASSDYGAFPASIKFR
jgi:hypothetical protein